MKNLSYILSAFLLVFLYSCKSDSSIESDVEGRWELITKPYFNPILNYNPRYFWEFKGNNIYVTFTDSNEVLIDSCVTNGIFEIKNGVLGVIAPIVSCGESTYDGEWEVQKLDDKHMYLLRYLPRGTIWLEFAKR